MVRTQIQLTEAQAEGLKRLSHATGRSMADLIRGSVDQLLAAGPDPEREERKRRAIAAIGCLEGGPEDLSERHDDYLAEAYSS
jgi:hypothetical protein